MTGNRYLPLRGFAYWEHLLMWITFTLAMALFVDVFVAGPLLDGHRPPTVAGLVLALVLTYAASSRFFMIIREDQGMIRQLITFGCAPLVGLWVMLVLRPLRLYAICTCRRTGWGTRAKVEVGLATAAQPQPGAVEASLGKSATDELAVAVDCFNPLLIAEDALEVEDQEYYRSWTPR